MTDQHSPRAFAESIVPEALNEYTMLQPQHDERYWQVTGWPYPPEKPLIYIKHGPTTFTMRDSEARTQQWVFDALEKLPPGVRRGIRVPEIYRVIEYNGLTWILMELVPGKSLLQFFDDWESFQSVADRYFDKIADGLRLLLSLPVPDGTPPGPAGGGIIRHPLFKEHQASLQYDSLDMMERHLNNVAHTLRADAPGVKLEREMHLVLSDLYEGNFMFTEDGDLYIIDFEQANFLPLSFMSYAVIQQHRVCGPMQDRLEKELLPQENMEAMRGICYWFVMSWRKIGALLGFPSPCTVYSSADSLHPKGFLLRTAQEICSLNNRQVGTGVVNGMLKVFSEIYVETIAIMHHGESPYTRVFYGDDYILPVTAMRWEKVIIH